MLCTVSAAASDLVEVVLCSGVLLPVFVLVVVAMTLLGRKE